LLFIIVFDNSHCRQTQRITHANLKQFKVTVLNLFIYVIKINDNILFYFYNKYLFLLLYLNIKNKQIMKKLNFTKLAFLAILMTSFVFITSCGDNQAKNEAAAKQAVEEAQKKVDHFAEVDADKDGKLSKEEFVGHTKEEFGKKDKNGDGKLDKDECGMIDKFDANKDGGVNPEEFAKGHETMFAKIDADKDGTVTKEEFVAFRASMKKGKCGEGKCGGEMKKEMKKGKCGEGKCGEGKCGK